MRRVTFTCLVMPLLLSCAGTETVEPVNQDPTIRFTFTPIVVDYKQKHTLTVAVSDPDGDPLTVEWSISSGQLTGSSDTERIWDPVDSVGEDTLTVTVSDGEQSASIAETIKRGFRFTSSDVAGFTFTRDRSPWIIDPPVVTIGWLGTTVIEPGVEMYINVENLSIDIVGDLESIGTESDTILIHPNDRTLRCGDGRGWWKGFVVRAEGPVTGRVNMVHTEVSYGDKNIYLLDGETSAHLRYCRLVCGGRAGVEISSGGTLVVDHSDVSHSRSYGILVSSSSTIPDTVLITNNEIRSNDHTGIALDLLDNTQSAAIRIEGNRIELNSIAGITLTNAVWPTIHHNDFSLNNLSNVTNLALLRPFPSTVPNPSEWDTLWATDNFWGGAYEPGEVSLIEQTVVDSKDDNSLGTRIIVVPWQNSTQVDW